MDVADQLVWEEKVDALNKAMLLLMNSKNNNAKKDLCLAYSQGNKLAYSLNVESIARVYNIKSVNNPYNKRGIRTERRVMNVRTRIGRSGF